MSAPMEFPGTPEEKAANYHTHIWFDGRCGDCDCNSFGRVSEWPCGVSVPRDDQDNGDYLMERFLAQGVKPPLPGATVPTGTSFNEMMGLPDFNDAEREDH